ncbi:hypothetical protein FHR90_003342 [Endobacter medicaginis]|uniref:Uncharacterized protein n=1 Tax=Endobacter medicaginis TaxID=1181271 RepID=A0A850NRL7_9PROT|nr:hypothetical protein [Endobacter medicaginis]MBB3175486.1 hypothetical protein [Endobacter medicaginis]MCX5476723.1 hypothetical protein [Endobacter medicaginis]NVN30032.1 hypothetical protein [Endobacter medicaginis]
MRQIVDFIAHLRGQQRGEYAEAQATAARLSLTETALLQMRVENERLQSELKEARQDGHEFQVDLFRTRRYVRSADEELRRVHPASQRAENIRELAFYIYPDEPLDGLELMPEMPGVMRQYLRSLPFADIKRVQDAEWVELLKFADDPVRNPLPAVTRLYSDFAESTQAAGVEYKDTGNGEYFNPDFTSPYCR